MLFALLALGFILLSIEQTRFLSPLLFLPALIMLLLRIKKNNKNKNEKNEQYNTFHKRTNHGNAQRSRYNYTVNKDWFTIREKVFSSKGRVCSNCGSRTDLDVHHIKPLSLGGSNKLSNLIVLCRYCHETVHKQEFHADDGDDNNYENTDNIGERMYYGTDSKIRSKKAIAINDAINYKRDISFMYKKWQSDHYERRCVSPLELFLKEGKHYLRSYCHLRKAERVFRLSRMKNVTIMR